MARLLTHYCKYNMINIRGPFLHTMRSIQSILPSTGHVENNTEPDFLQCLRPTAVKVSDAPTLAGDPRSASQRNQRIEPEIFDKWNQVPRYDNHKEWFKLSVFCTDF